MKTMKKLFAGAALALSLGTGAAEAQVLFWSTQAKPVEETQKMRDQVLSGFEGGVDYQPQDDGPWLTRVQAELQAGSGTIGVLGAALGILVGIFFGWALVAALGDQGISELAVPVGQLVVYVVIAAVFGVLAAIGPARRAAKLDILRAITVE